MCTCVTVYLKHVSYVCAQSLSRVQLFATLWTVALQAPLSMGFPRQEYWSELPLPPLGIFPTQGSNLGLPRCRQTLYRLSHQSSNKLYFLVLKFSYRTHLRDR